MVCTRECCLESPNTRRLGPQGLGRRRSGKTAADSPEGDQNTQKRDRRVISLLFHIIFRKKNATRKNTPEASTEEHSTGGVSSALPRRSISGHGCRHKKVFFGQELHKHTVTPLLNSHPTQLHCKMKYWPESKLHPKTSPGASSPARRQHHTSPTGPRGRAAAAESSTGRFGAC